MKVQLQQDFVRDYPGSFPRYCVRSFRGFVDVVEPFFEVGVFMIPVFVAHILALFLRLVRLVSFQIDSSFILLDFLPEIHAALRYTPTFQL